MKLHADADGPPAGFQMFPRVLKGSKLPTGAWSLGVSGARSPTTRVGEMGGGGLVSAELVMVLGVVLQIDSDIDVQVALVEAGGGLHKLDT